MGCDFCAGRGYVLSDVGAQEACPECWKGTPHPMSADGKKLEPGFYWMNGEPTQFTGHAWYGIGYEQALLPKPEYIGARINPDDADEIARLRTELAALRTDVSRLREALDKARVLIAHHTKPEMCITMGGGTLYNALEVYKELMQALTATQPKKGGE